LLKTHKNTKKNKFIVSERQYIGITATINDFRSTLASCEGEGGMGDGDGDDGGGRQRGNGDGGKSDGDSDNGCGRAMTMATKRVMMMVTATMVDEGGGRLNGHWRRRQERWRRRNERRRNNQPARLDDERVGGAVRGERVKKVSSIVHYLFNILSVQAPPVVRTGLNSNFFQDPEYIRFNTLLSSHLNLSPRRYS